MAVNTFIWNPDEGSTQTEETAVRVASFGDGYEQRSTDGINNVREVWSVTFTGNTAVLAPIRSFLKARAGTEAFNWQTPYQDTLAFVCDKWAVSRQTPGVHTLSAEFRQVFEP